MSYIAVVNKETLQIACKYRYHYDIEIQLKNDFPEKQYYFIEIPSNINYKYIQAILKDNTIVLIENTDDFLNEIREKRNKLLIATDWTQNNDSPLTEEKKIEWRIYRQLLRDLPTNTTDPTNPTWPSKPS